jgi:glycosyltransferase involved in cell wall biosynthesis
MTAISVVMGVHNGGSTLAATIDSILAQTETDFEVIVVDDGSTDETADVLAKYAGRDTRVRMIPQKNAGLTRALIAGCAAARGTYIARHDAGDLSDARRFAIQKRALDSDAEIVFVSCATRFAGPELEPLYVARPAGPALTAAHVIDLTLPYALTDGPTHHGSVMFRRDAYQRAGGYRAAFYYGQDFDLWYRLAELGKFQAIDEVLYTARTVPESISSTAGRAQRAIAELSLAALHARQRGGDDREHVARAATIARANAKPNPAAGLYFIGEALRRNRDPRARRYLRRAIGADPLSGRAWLRYLQSLILWS